MEKKKEPEPEPEPEVPPPPEPEAPRGLPPEGALSYAPRGRPPPIPADNEPYRVYYDSNEKANYFSTNPGVAVPSGAQTF